MNDFENIDYLKTLSKSCLDHNIDFLELYINNPYIPESREDVEKWINNLKEVRNG